MNGPEEEEYSEPPLLLQKPTSRLGWYVGPRDVPFVYGPLLPKTDGMLLSLMHLGFGQDVHVLNFMTRLISLDFYLPSSFLRENSEIDSHWNYVEEVFAKAEAEGEVSDSLRDALLVTHCLVRLAVPRVPPKVTKTLCDMAVDEREGKGPLLSTGQLLPIEYLSATGNLISTINEDCERVNATGAAHEVSLPVDENIPHLLLAQRCLSDLQRENPTGKETTGATRTAAVMQLLCAVCENLPETVNHIVEENQIRALVRLLEHPVERVVVTTIRLIGSFTCGNDEPLVLLLQCGFLESLGNLLNRPRCLDPTIKKDAIWALSNTCSDHAEEVMEKGMDTLCLQFLSADQPHLIRDEAVLLFDLLLGNHHLKVGHMFHVGQGIASILALCSREALEETQYDRRHRKYFYTLLNIYRWTLVNVTRNDHPKLYADCVYVLGDPVAVDGFWVLEKERAAGADAEPATRVTRFFETEVRDEVARRKEREGENATKEGEPKE